MAPRTVPGTSPPTRASRCSSREVRKCPYRQIGEPNHALTLRLAAHVLNLPSSPITRRPSECSTRPISSKVSSASSTKQRTVTATTISKLSSANGSSSARPTHSPISHCSLVARSRVAATICHEASSPTTSAPRLWSVTANRPSPQPRSRTRRPFTLPTSSRTSSSSSAPLSTRALTSATSCTRRVQDVEYPVEART